MIKKDGYVFTSEPFNLMNKNSKKYSGFTRRKAIGVSANEKGIVLKTKLSKYSKSVKPPTSTHTVVLTRDPRRVAKSVKNATRTYRRELRLAALARASALQKGRKTIKKGSAVAKRQRRRHTKQARANAKK